MASTLAAFFTIIINGNVGPRIAQLIRITYTVALQKDPTNLSKLRPLGIPSAIRRIAAALVMGKYKPEFAKLLLPVNFAVGVSGGIEIITNTIRLGWKNTSPIERIEERHQHALWCHWTSETCSTQCQENNCAAS